MGERLAGRVEQVRTAVLDGHLRCGVLYGDPSPEILRNPSTGDLALIDWGTPSWGPLLFDLLTWERFFEEAAPGGRAGQELRAGYLGQCPASAEELVAAAIVGELIEAIRDTWTV